MVTSRWGIRPRRSVERECALRGRAAVVEGCRSLLRGEDVDTDLLLALGGPPARWARTGTAPGPDYWTRVWAARALLWVWDDAALPEITGALTDEAWRVREMALRVVARHGLGDLIEEVAMRQADPRPRVAAAASRAVITLTKTGA